MLTGPALADPVSPRRLLEVADLANPVVSPDGRLVAFRMERASVERNTYDTIWYVEGTDGQAPPHRVSDGGIPLRDSAGRSLPAISVWSPDGRWIYYRALMAGTIDVWRAAADGSGAEPVTRDPADVRDFLLSADGRTLTFNVGATREDVIEAEQSEYDRGIRIDESVPIGQPLFRSGNIEGRLATQRYGPVWFDRVPLLAGRPSDWKTIDLKTRKVQELSSSYKPPSEVKAQELLSEAWALALDPKKGRVALLTRVGKLNGLLEKPGVELVMLPSKKAKTPNKCRAQLCTNKAITGIQWRPNSDEVVFTVTDPREGLAQSIYRWNVQTGAVHPVVRSSGLLDGGRDRSSACGLSSDALTCVAAAADQPPRLERIDLASGRYWVLFDPNASLRQAMKAGARARLLRWTDKKGQEFTGQFFPAGITRDGPPPLFVSYYRCEGFLRGGMGDEWPFASLAQSGISALCINAAPIRADAVERYEQGRSAVESVADLLASKNEIDRARVGMGGLSFGTEVTMWTAMKSHLLAAASVTSMAISPNYYLLGSGKGNAFFTGLKGLWGLAAPDETPARWRVISPTFHLDQIRAPVLMQMPEQEYIHALDYTIPLIRRKQADLYVFPNEPHQKFQPKHKLAAYERNLDWFRFWLQDYEDLDPEKAEQYKHWEEMRAAQTAIKGVAGRK